MAGTGAVQAKIAIYDLLVASSDLDGVQVGYVWPGGEVEREVIYGGKIEFDQELLTFRRTGGRQPRLESATLHWLVEVRDMDSDSQAADLRCVQLGAVLENVVAADPTLGGVVLAATVASGELTAIRDDDAVYSQLSYAVTVRSELT